MNERPRAPRGGGKSRWVLQNGIAIKEFREREGWSCATLAAEAGIAQSTLSNIENEARSTKHEVLEKIAAALDLPVGAITRERSQVAPRRPGSASSSVAAAA